MPAFAYALKQAAVSFTIVPDLTPSLQNRLDVVQHQQAAIGSEVLNQQRDLTVYLFWQDCSLLIRYKLDALLQHGYERWSIVE